MNELNTTMTPAQSADALERLLLETRHTLAETEREYNSAKLYLDGKKKNGTLREKAVAEAEFAAAEEVYRKTRQSLPAEVKNKLSSIRSALDKHLQIGGLADPAQVDMATVELLKSGAMTPADLENLARKALGSGNNTMLRMIVAEAERKFDELTRVNGSNEKRKEYMAVMNLSGKSRYQEYMGAVSAVEYVLQRCFRSGGDSAYFDAQKESTASALSILRK